MAYTRRSATQAILRALQTVGGSESRESIKSVIAEDDLSGFSYDDVFEAVVSKNGNRYIPFNYDFNFSVKELALVKFIEQPKRGEDLVLTSKGRVANPDLFPNEEQQETINAYWEEKNKARAAKNKQPTEKVLDNVSNTADETTTESDPDDWKTDLIEQLKQFSPKKFENFSRLLISKMGVKIDAKKGQVMSGDHGIDGFGYFESDEFRTSRVAIQSKRYTNQPVGEPEIDKLKGSMDYFNAEYGIFITTSHFTDQAKMKAVHGSMSITLIDGRRIADLVERYHLHVTPVQTFILDDYYFEED